MALLLSGSTFAATYGLADLEILSQENSQEEFFKHALDLRPSERNEAWKTMVSKMAVALENRVLKESQIKEEDYRKIEELYDWPSLRPDDVFRLKRQQIALGYFKVCLKKEKPCWDDIKNFWEKDPTDPEMALHLAELVETHPGAALAPWPFLEVALKSSLSEFYCKKPFVMNVLWDKFTIDYIRMGPAGDFLKKIDQTVHPDCIPSLNAEALSRLYHPQKLDDREVAFEILDSQSKADQKIKDFFFTVYLLEKPSQGELFNYSWSRLKELGGAEVRREVVLENIKKLDPLPDDIFSSLDVQKRRAVVNLLKDNFPEYLDFYTQQCILFFGGKGSFPEGNPTVHCQDLMSSDLAPSVLPADKIRQYKEVKKI